MCRKCSRLHTGPVLNEMMPKELHDFVNEMIIKYADDMESE